MRLEALIRDQEGLGKWLVRLVSWYAGVDYGAMAIAYYRRSFFGRHMRPCFRRHFERPAHWSRGEVELFAAFVSRLNACNF